MPFFFLNEKNSSLQQIFIYLQFLEFVFVWYLFYIVMEIQISAEK